MAKLSVILNLRFNDMVTFLVKYSNRVSVFFWMF